MTELLPLRKGQKLHEILNVFSPAENVTLDGENCASIEVGQIRCDEKHFAWEKKVYHENISVKSPILKYFGLKSGGRCQQWDKGKSILL